MASSDSLHLVPARHDRVSLLEAIAAAAPAFGALTKDSSNNYLKTAYLALPGLLAAVKRPLLEQGVTVYSQIMLHEGSWIIRTTLALVNGSEEVCSDFPVADLSMQRIGATVTYGTRYNLFALLAICPEDADDDGNSPAIYGAGEFSPSPLPGLPASGHAGTPVASHGLPPLPVPANFSPAQPIQVLS
jgi:hypothetical protein